jgi:hypothetical protein
MELLVVATHWEHQLGVLVGLVGVYEVQHIQVMVEVMDYTSISLIQ